jgi:signal peptidase II
VISPTRPRIFGPRIIGLAVAIAIYLADQVVKYIMMVPLKLPEIGQIYIMPNFNFTFTQNTGVSLGLLHATNDTARWALVALTAGIALVVLVWMWREKATGDVAALGLVLGGALGNIRDRINLGYVIDYADLHFGSYRPFMIFNLADAAITIGVLIILARSFISREKGDKNVPPPANTATEN